MIQLEVWGGYALFTRPEMKVERVSYDVMTPSAARGLIEASEIVLDVDPLATRRSPHGERGLKCP